MRSEWLTVAVVLLPPLGLWAAYPRRSAAAGAFLGIALAAGAALLVSAPPAGRAALVRVAGWRVVGG